MGGFIYLIEAVNGQGQYKIGMTRSKNVQKRLKQLQTGNANDLVVRSLFETERPFKLEKMLHNKFSASRLDGEWFSLTEEEVNGFVETCEHYQAIIDSLKGNPFF